jgi:O-antigen/teichoic acid export membrane protein
MRDLKAKTLRGGFARLCAQAANFALRIGSLMILARLLGPKDFGLVGMVTAFTGVLNLFRDFGLSSAAVQRTTVTDEQVSTLFWINIAFGMVLGLITVGAAPFIATFYHEPRLVWVTIVLAAGFLFNAAGIQHSVLLQRQMRFTALAVIGVASLIIGTAIGMGAAWVGYGYWALVAMTVSLPFTNTIGLWLATHWIPGLPRRGTGIRSMVRFGGTLTLSGLVVYIANNFEKVLLGRFWGAAAIGIYGRAYQLVNIPTDNLNSAAGEVGFSALSRLQNDPPRLKSYFLKGYSLILALTIPITIACAFFADDVVYVVLGPQWSEAVPIFRLLAPTILVFAIANPLSWLLSSIGLVSRLLKMGLVIAPVMIAGYFVAVPYGPKGVALAVSAIMILWLVPLLTWALHDTSISPLDIVPVVGKPLISGVLAGVPAFAIRLLCSQFFQPFPRLVVELVVLFGVFFGILFFATGQRSFYAGLLRELTKRSRATEFAIAAQE